MSDVLLSSLRYEIEQFNHYGGQALRSAFVIGELLAATKAEKGDEFADWISGIGLSSLQAELLIQIVREGQVVLVKAKANNNGNQS